MRSAWLVAMTPLFVGCATQGASNQPPTAPTAALPGTGRPTASVESSPPASAPRPTHRRAPDAIHATLARAPEACTAKLLLEPKYHFRNLRSGPSVENDSFRVLVGETVCLEADAEGDKLVNFRLAGSDGPPSRILSAQLRRSADGAIVFTLYNPLSRPMRFQAVLMREETREVLLTELPSIGPGTTNTETWNAPLEVDYIVLGDVTLGAAPGAASQSSPSAGPPRALPGTPIRFGGADGSAKERAIVITGALHEKEGVGAEYAYIAVLYGPAGSTWKPLQQSLLREGSRQIDEVVIEHAGARETLYFDVTEFFGKP